MDEAKPLTEAASHARGPLHTALNRAGRALIVAVVDRGLDELSRLERAARAYSGQASAELEEERERARIAAENLEAERERGQKALSIIERMRLEAVDLRMNLERAEEELNALRGEGGT